MSQNTIKEQLHKLLLHLEKLNHSCPKYLDLGLPFSDIQRTLARVSLQPTDDLINLFSWKNGSSVNTIPLGHLALIPGFYLMPLEECCSNYIALKKNDFWKATWFPVLSNSGGDFYVIDIQTNEILGYYIYEDEPMVEYNSLKTLLETYNQCYELGIIYKTSEGYLDMDYNKHALVAQQANPNLSFWADFLHS